MNTIKKPGNTRLFYFLCLILATLSSLWLWHFLREFADPSGANGYFYLKQTESLSHRLGFYFKDYSLAFCLPVLFMTMTGDSLISFQLAITTIWFLLVFGCGVLMRNLTRSCKPMDQLFLVFCGLTALVCSTQLYEFTLTFFKNAFALTILIWGFACFYSLGSTKKRFILSALLFIIALLSHKSVLLILVLCGLSWVLQKISWKRGVLFGGGFAIALSVFLLQFEKANAYLKVLFNFFMGPKEWWHWFSRLGYGNLEMQWSLLALLTTLLLYFFLRRRLAGEERIFTDATAMILAIALHPFQLPGPNGPSYRILLFAPALGVPLLIVCISSLNKKKFFALLALFPFTAQPFLGTRYIDDVFTPWAVLHEDVLKISEFVKSEDHLTSHHGLEFFIDYTTGIRSRSFLSDHVEKKSFRIAYIDRSWLQDPETQRALRAHALLEIGSEYILLTETEWLELVNTFGIPRHWKNPDQHRPDYIYE